MQEKTREVWRKIAHILIGTAGIAGAAFVYQYFGEQILDLVFAGVLVLLVFADVLIADYGWKLPLYHHLQRKHEEQGLHSATLAVISSIIAYKLFALPVAFAAIAMLVYGDAAAAIVGIFTSVGRKKKTFLRILAMLVVSCVIGYFIFGWIGAIMGIVATLAECLVTKIDDSLTIPLFAGLVGHVLMRLFL